MPVYRASFFIIPLISAHFRHYSVIPAIPGWPPVQSRSAVMSGEFCLLAVMYIEHMLYKRRRLGKGRITVK